MKISIIVSNSLKIDPRVIKQIKIAISKGYEVQFVGYMDKFYDKSFLDSVGCRYDIVYLGEKYLHSSKRIYRKIYRWVMNMHKIIDYICDFKPDIIHANDFDTLEAGYIAAKKCHSRIIYDSHEICAENIGISENKLIKKYITMTEQKLLPKIDKMISVSNAAADYFANKYGIDRPTVITNCPMKNTIPLKEKSVDAFEALFQGVMTVGRGYEEFVLSGKYTDDGVRLVLRGYGPIENDLRNIITQEKLSDKVRFDSPVLVVEVVSAASSSHVGVVTTKPINTNFELSVSNKLFEYAAAGLPVILSDIPEHRYLNDKYNFGIIIDEVTPKKIAEAINELYRNKDKYTLFAENAKKMADEMVWENEAKKLIQIYEELGRK